MASDLDHVALANRNHEALEHLLEQPGRFPEWITTIAFYKALQMVEASFAHTQTGRTSTHGDRLDRLKREKRYQHIFKHYRPLWEASMVARYLSDLSGRDYRSFTDYMKPEVVVAQIVRHRLRQIENSLAQPEFLSAQALRDLRRLA